WLSANQSKRGSARCVTYTTLTPPAGIPSHLPADLPALVVLAHREPALDRHDACRLRVHERAGGLCRRTAWLVTTPRRQHDTPDDPARRVPGDARRGARPFCARPGSLRRGGSRP